MFKIFKSGVKIEDALIVIPDDILEVNIAPSARSRFTNNVVLPNSNYYIPRGLLKFLISLRLLPDIRYVVVKKKGSKENGV